MCAEDISLKRTFRENKAMSSFEVQGDEVDSRSWNVVCVNADNGYPGTEYLVKGLFEPQGYEVMLSDGVTVWEEKIDTQDLLERLKVR